MPPLAHINWLSYYRIISTNFPTIDLFEGVAPPEDWEALFAVEQLTNPRIRDEIGDITLVPPERRVSGNGASYVIYPFVQISPERPSRFSSGRLYGAFYAAQNFETAVREVAYHRAKFHLATNDDPVQTQGRVLKGSINAHLHDVRGPEWDNVRHPTDYSESQRLAEQLRKDGSEGIIYRSIRHPGNDNFAAFWPDVMNIPIQTNHIAYHWNGTCINKYFDYGTQEWAALPDLLAP